MSDSNDQSVDSNNENEEKERPKKKTVLIFGVSSFVGSNLAEFLKKDFRVVGTYNKNSIQIPGVLTLPCDVLNKDEVQLILFASKPDITIYAVGLSSIFECSKQEQLADALNTSGLFNVAEYSQRYKSQICYISSGFVFSGESKKYIEMDIPDPSTVYGKSQAAAEFYVQKTSLNYLIFRCSRLYGRSINPLRPGFFENMQKKLKLGQNVMMDSSIKMGFIDIYFLAMIIKMCIDKGVVNRLFQISSQDVMSYYDFAKMYCRIFHEPEDLIVKGKWPYPILLNQAAVTRSDDLNFKLDLSNIESFLNISLPTIEESLTMTLKRFGGSLELKKQNKKGDGINFI